MADPTTDPAPAIKPGWQTSEFYFTAAAMIIGLMLASGLIVPGSSWDRIVGLAATVLAQLGYTASRATVKANQ